VKKWIGRILAIVIAVALVNDFGRFLIGWYTLDKESRSMAYEAGRIAKQDPSTNSAWPTAYQMSKDGGFEIIAYEQNQYGVVATTRLFVSQTMIMGPIRALLEGNPLRAPVSLEQTVRTPQ
jgi:hypothetical protein